MCQSFYDDSLLLRLRVAQWLVIGTTVLFLFRFTLCGPDSEARLMAARRAMVRTRGRAAMSAPVVDSIGATILAQVRIPTAEWTFVCPFGNTLGPVLLSGSLQGEQRATGYEGSVVRNWLYGYPAWSTGPAPVLRTTLIAPFCRDVQRILDSAVVTGAIVCIRTDGRIVALADSPTVDPARYWTDVHYRSIINQQKDSRLSPRSLSAQTVGSTMKVLTAAILTEQGKMPAGFSVDCVGHERINGQRKRCAGVHGTTGLGRALEVSCSVYFWSCARRYLKQDTFLDYMYRVGVAGTNVRGLNVQPAEFLLPDADQETWLMTVIGLQCRVPLLGLAQGFATVVTGRRPTLRILADEPARTEAVFSTNTSGTVRRGMARCALCGTGRAVRAGRAARWQAIGKTGTVFVRKVKRTTPYGSAERSEGAVCNAVFAAYSPPARGMPGSDLVTVVFLEDAGSGSRAARVAGKVVDVWRSQYASR